MASREAGSVEGTMHLARAGEMFLLELLDAALLGTSVGILPLNLTSLRSLGLSTAEGFVSPPTGLGFISSVTHPSGFACARLRVGSIISRLRRWKLRLLADSTPSNSYQ